MRKVGKFYTKAPPETCPDDAVHCVLVTLHFETRWSAKDGNFEANHIDPNGFGKHTFYSAELSSTQDTDKLRQLIVDAVGKLVRGEPMVVTYDELPRSSKYVRVGWRKHKPGEP